MLSEYINLIFEQRGLNPLHNKDHRLIELPKRNKSFNTEISELAKWPTAFLSNIIYRQNDLFADVTDNYYYEFIHKGEGYTLKNWKYFYIPVSKYNELNNAIALENILPSFFYYDLNINSQINLFFPKEVFLYLNDISQSYFYLRTNSANKHPLLSHFVFTGKCFFSKASELIYEYKDTLGYTDDESVTYFSKIRPKEIYYLSSNVIKQHLEKEIQIQDLIGMPPDKLEFYDETNFLNLKFTGYTTNYKFSKYKKWFEYYSYLDGQPFEKILLPNPPTKSSLDFVVASLFSKSVGFAFNQINNEQRIIINQISSNKITTIN
jgi:hypothetical protein